MFRKNNIIKIIVLSAIFAPAMANAGFVSDTKPYGENIVRDSALITSDLKVKRIEMIKPSFLTKKPVQLPPKGSEFEKAIIKSVSQTGTLFDVLRLIYNGMGFTVVENPALVDMEVRVEAYNQHVAKITDLIAYQHNLQYFIDWDNKVVTMEAIPSITKMYKIDALPVTRSYSDSTTGVPADASGASSGSGSSLITANTVDSWKEINDFVSMILASDIYSGTKDADKLPSFQISKSTGMLIVHATADTQNSILSYLNKMNGIVNQEILIETMLLEVSLDATSGRGIDWNAVFSSIGNTGVQTATLGSLPFSAGSPIGSGAVISFTLGNATGVIKALEEQGPVNVVSQPMISTLNGRSGIIKVGNNAYYVTDMNRETQVTVAGSVTTVTPTFSQMFSGISLAVTPQLDSEGSIIMHIHPVITSITPSSQKIDGVDFPSPITNVREEDVIIKSKNGGVAVIGGLLSKQVSHRDSGIPVLKDMPILGGVFSSTVDTSSRKELVILIKATAVSPGDTERLLDDYKEGMDASEITTHRGFGEFTNKKSKSEHSKKEGAAEKLPKDAASLVTSLLRERDALKDDLEDLRSDSSELQADMSSYKSYLSEKMSSISIESWMWKSRISSLLSSAKEKYQDFLKEYEEIKSEVLKKKDRLKEVEADISLYRI